MKIIKEFILKKGLNKKFEILKYQYDGDLNKIKCNHEFARQCVLLEDAVPSSRKSGDFSVDGVRIKDGVLIQVKGGSGGVSRPEAQKLLGAMIERKQKHGILIGAGFSPETRNFAGSIRKNGYLIELISIESLQNKISIKNKKSA